MVKPFQFTRLPKIYFKAGGIADLTSIARQYGRNILLVTGNSSFKNSRFAVTLLDDFKKKSIECTIYMVSEEPSPDSIDDAVRVFKDKEIDLVIGIGGGSVMDAGKAISAMIYRTESVAEFLEVVGNKEHPGTRLPYIAIPTTSGTGSEATKNAVISRIGKGGFKRSLRHDNFVPDVALVDPELTLSCPLNITAASGMDCFTQLTEAYLSVKSNEYTDALAFEGLKAIKYSLARAYRNGNDIDARTGMSFAALTSGICLANAGLGVVHGFASSIGGMFDIPHGMICGTLMAKSNEVNIRELRKAGKNRVALLKYSNLGKLFLNEIEKSDDFYIDGFISFLYQLSDELELKVLANSGFSEKDIELICLTTDIKNNPVGLVPENLNEIITSVIK